MSRKDIVIGVMALQGAFAEHITSLKKLGVTAIEIRKKNELEQIDGLIIPGGESTTMRTLNKDSIFEAIAASFSKPIWGTCAGAILLANSVHSGIKAIGGVDMTISRNFFGRQAQSFEKMIKMNEIGDSPFNCIFIRAPAITHVGPSVSVLGELETNHANVIIAAKDGNRLVTVFHPELTEDLRFHQYFVDMVKKEKNFGKDQV